MGSTVQFGYCCWECGNGRLMVKAVLSLCLVAALLTQPSYCFPGSLRNGMDQLGGLLLNVEVVNRN